MDTFFKFFTFADPNVRFVTLGVLLLSVSSATVGVFPFLKKRSLISDAISHAILPGICLAFIIQGTKNPVLLLLGAFLTGWLSLMLIHWINTYSKIKEDTAIALVLSVFFGIGIVLMTYIQSINNANKTGLKDFLLGKAATLTQKDLLSFGVVAILLLLAIFLFYKEFKLISFDRNFAQAIGLPVQKLELLLNTLIVLAIVVGIQAVGVVLMSAMLITPAAAAKYWTQKLQRLLLLSALLGALAGLGGAYLSYVKGDFPTGPWMVLIISFIALFSFFFAPKKGILARYFSRKRHQSKILEENILKIFFNLGERKNGFYSAYSVEKLLTIRPMMKKNLTMGLRRLKRQGFLKKTNNTWMLTVAGKNKGMRIVKLHRLWELYLTEYLRIAPDHVHEDAESIEHIITPEIEQKLEEKLQYPLLDPHNSEIPYQK